MSVQNFEEFQLNENLIGDFVKKLVKNFSSKKSIDDVYFQTKKILNDFKKDLISNPRKLEWEEIENDINFLKKELGEDLVKKLNLDIFMSNLYTITGFKTDEKIINNHFNKYINNLHNRISKALSKDDKNIDKDLEKRLKKYQELRQKIEPRISKRKYNKKILKLKIELLKFQEWYKENNEKIIILFEGRDAAGKGSCINTITDSLNPKYFEVATFGVPTDWEKEHWFERYEKFLPKPGNMTLYDRSWYNRAVNDPVMGYCTQEQHEEFMNKVVPFEKKLIEDGYKIIKFWLSVNKDIQKLRFDLRKTSPIKYWKFSENDLKTMDKWEKFTYYKEKMFKLTSTKECPWVNVNSDDKQLARLNIIRYILNQMPYDNKNEDFLGEIKPEILIPLI